MKQWLVTVKVQPSPTHKPWAKETGPCPVAPEKQCTDRTGAHHTVIAWATTLEEVQQLLSEFHITRIEEV